MKTIWKFPLDVTTEDQVVKMPLGAKIVHVEMQGMLPCIWAIVDEQVDFSVDRTFIVCGTGWGVSPFWNYVGTCLDGSYVWHVWEA